MNRHEEAALHNLNATMNNIADMLAAAYEKFNEAYYHALEHLGHSEQMHNVNLSFQNFMNEINNTTFNESDFPDVESDDVDANLEAYIKGLDIEGHGVVGFNEEQTKDDHDADRGDNEGHPEEI